MKTMTIIQSVLSAGLFLFALPISAQLAEPDENGIVYGHIQLNVSDVERHSQLWVEYFDGEVIEHDQLHALRFPNMIILLNEREPLGGSQESVMHHFGFKVRDTEQFLDHWRAAGMEVDAEFTGAESQHNAYVTMPDGVYVELQEDRALPVRVSGYHIHYFTPRYQELLDWYTEVFSLERRPRGSIETTTNVPGMNLSFGDADEERLPTQGRAIDHVGFEVENLAGFVERLEAQGIELDQPYREDPALGVATALLTDPAGVQIKLTEGLDAL